MSDTPQNRERLADDRAELEEIGARLRNTLTRLEAIRHPALPRPEYRDRAALLIYEAGQNVDKLQARIEWRLSGRESY